MMAAARRALEKTTAITGIGLSEVARQPSAHTPLALTLQACRQAIADAGLARERIDGIATWPGFLADGSGMSQVGTHEVMRALGLRLDWFCGAREAPGQLSAVFNAAAAVATGLANHVLVFRTISEASARAVDRSANAWGGGAGRARGIQEWTVPFGAVTPVNVAAMMAQRHFHEFGTGLQQLGRLVVNTRRNAGLNPGAVFRAPMTLDDYLGARAISTPLGLYDCDVPVDASVALVVSRLDEARSLAQPPIRIEAIGSAMHRPDTWLRPEQLTDTCSSDAAAMLWRRTDLRPRDVAVAQLYDGYSIFAFLWLEALGFCERGGAGEFVGDGSRIALEGELPVNTNGGQLSAGRLHGLGTVHEACTQLWGRGGTRQVRGPPATAVATGGFGNGFSGAMLLVRE